MVRYVLALVVVLPVLLLVVSTLRGRSQVKACCPSDPSRDLRMRAAFEDEHTEG